MTNYSRSGLMMMTEDGGRDDRELLSFSCLATYFILLNCCADPKRFPALDSLPGTSSHDQEPLPDDPHEPRRIEEFEHVILAREQVPRGLPCLIQDVERLPKRQVRLLHEYCLVEVHDEPQHPQSSLFFLQCLVHMQSPEHALSVCGNDTAVLF